MADIVMGWMRNIKWYIFVLAIVALFMGVLIVIYILSNFRHTQSLAEQEFKMANIQTQLDTVSSVNNEIRRTAVRMVTGLDVFRVAKDEFIAEEFISKVMTWTTHTEYEGLRQMCMTEYDLDENSSFMQVFMPSVINVDIDGCYYNHIDTDGLNSTYEDMVQYVIGIDEGDYSYVSFVDWSTKDQYNRICYSTCVFEYTIDDSGEIHDVAAYTSTNHA